MDLISEIKEERPKKNNRLGAAHLRGRDAYKDVPILKQPTWHNEVAAYFYFGGMSAGAAMIGSIADVVGGERNKRMARTAHYVSLATLIPCPPLLIDDLGYPARFHHMMRIFKPSSPMNLGSWALLIHGAGATVTVMRMLAGEGKLPIVGPLLKLFPERLLAALGLPSSFVLAGYTGVLLGTTSIPVWFNSPLLGALFMASAFSTGAAATSFIGLLTGRHETRPEHTEFATIGLLSGATELALLGAYVATSDGAARPLTHGKASPLLKAALATLVTSAVMEAVALGLGANGGRTVATIASAAALAGAAMMRWSVVLAGRESAADREGTLHSMRSRPGKPGWGRWRG